MNAQIAIEFALAYQKLEAVKELRRKLEAEYEDAKTRFQDAQDALKTGIVSVRSK